MTQVRVYAFLIKIETIYLGSNDIIINSELCLTSNCANGKKYKGDTHYPFMKEFVFGSGVIVGVLSKSNFYMKTYEIKDVLFYEMLAEQKILEEAESMDGIIGLGLIQNKATPNFLEYLDKQQNIPQIFSFYLNRKDDSKTSKVIFGGIQEKYFKGEPKYHPVKDPNYWALEIEGIFVGETDTGICSKKNKCKAIIDTGTSFIASSSVNVIQIASFF